MVMSMWWDKAFNGLCQLPPAIIPSRNLRFSLQLMKRLLSRIVTMSTLGWDTSEELKASYHACIHGMCVYIYIYYRYV